MFDRLEQESRIADAPPAESPAGAMSGTDEASGVPAQTLLRDTMDEISGEVLRTNPETQALIARCLDGTEPYGRDLKPTEPARLSPTMLQAVILRSAGFRGTEVSRALGITNVSVSVALNHPYGRKIIHALMGDQSGRVLDIRSRLEEYSGDLLDKLYGRAMLSEDIEQIGKITFGLLDRAGYGAKTKVEVEHKKATVTADADVMRRLATALEESEAVDSQVMATYIPKPPPDDGRTLTEGSGASRSDTLATRSEAGLSGGIRKVS